MRASLPLASSPPVAPPAPPALQVPADLPYLASHSSWPGDESGMPGCLMLPAHGPPGACRTSASARLVLTRSRGHMSQNDKPGALLRGLRAPSPLCCLSHISLSAEVWVREAGARCDSEPSAERPAAGLRPHCERALPFPPTRSKVQLRTLKCFMSKDILHGIKQGQSETT